MRDFIVDKFYVRLMDHNNLEEVKRVQKLRYDHLLKEYNPTLPSEGLDDDGYDDYSDTIMVIDSTNGVISGGYRVATLKTLKGKKFLTEEEYDIKALRECGSDILELGRAVVHPDYRSGFVIQVLFLAIYRYMIEHNCKYSFGLCSFHGNDPSLYSNGFKYLKKYHSFTDYEIKAVSNAFEFGDVSELDEALAKEELPGLLRMYLSFGNKVSFNGSIDFSFNSCDVLLIVKDTEINKRYINHFQKLQIKEVE